MRLLHLDCLNLADFGFLEPLLLLFMKFYDTFATSLLESADFASIKRFLTSLLTFTLLYLLFGIFRLLLNSKILPFSTLLQILIHLLKFELMLLAHLQQSASVLCLFPFYLLLGLFQLNNPYLT